MVFKQVVKHLESLSIMPKAMPGLEKIRHAVQSKSWFKSLNPEKIITVAGTNGKGTTAAALEALLLSANQKTGLYTSPHLVSITERIRLNGKAISEAIFIELFKDNQQLIEEHSLSHFESLTLMASDFFFSEKWSNGLDQIIFEVGLGGLYDATNIFPNKYAIITKIGLDHENILGNNLLEIAQNKFGIVKRDSIVIHHLFDSQFNQLMEVVREQTCSQWIAAKKWTSSYDAKTNLWMGELNGQRFTTNLIGPRAIENISTAISVFEKMGFTVDDHHLALRKINWCGRMQKVEWPGLTAPFYLSGDHNVQGMESLIEILQSYRYQKLHFIVGIGVDKDSDRMLELILKIPHSKLYLTETPFKGRLIASYPSFALAAAAKVDRNIENILNTLEATPDDMVVVSGSLYLVGQVLSLLQDLGQSN